MPISKFRKLLASARNWFFEVQREAKLDRTDRMRHAAKHAARKKARITREALKCVSRLATSRKHSDPQLLNVNARNVPVGQRAPLSTRPRSTGINNDAWQTRLSETERRLLGIWIAYHCPNGKGRTSATLYSALVVSLNLSRVALHKLTHRRTSLQTGTGRDSRAVVPPALGGTGIGSFTKCHSRTDAASGI